MRRTVSLTDSTESRNCLAVTAAVTESATWTYSAEGTRYVCCTWLGNTPARSRQLLHPTCTDWPPKANSRKIAWMNVVWKWTSNRVKPLVMTVHRVPLGENGGTVTLIACYSAEGSFVPSYCIVKGKKNNNKFEEGMPSGLRVTMNKTSAYVTTVVFMDWLRSHFIPRKESRSFMLELDGHRSHCSEVMSLNVLQRTTSYYCVFHVIQRIICSI